MTREEAIREFIGEHDRQREAKDIAVETMHKYQKIEDIYYHQRGMALENSLREVIEHGNYD